MDGFANLVLSPSGRPQYLGNSSSTILGRRFRDIVGIMNPGNQGLDIDRESSDCTLLLVIRQIALFVDIDQITGLH